MINRKNMRDDDEDDLLAAQNDFLQQKRQPSASVKRIGREKIADGTGEFFAPLEQ